jgi:hypothetical protein
MRGVKNMKTATSLILKTGFSSKEYEALLTKAGKARTQKRRMQELVPFDAPPIPEAVFDKRWKAPELLSKNCIWAIPAESSCLDVPDHFWMTSEPLFIEPKNYQDIYVINGDFFHRELSNRKKDAFCEGRKFDEKDMQCLYRDWAKTCVPYTEYARQKKKYDRPLFLIGRPIKIGEIRRK